MGKPDLICIDMFQTLVDINTRNESIWTRLLQNNYTDELAADYSHRMSSLIAVKYHDLVNRADSFLTLRKIFIQLLEQIDISAGSALSSSDAAEVLIEEHSKAEPYNDSLAFIERVSPYYRICLISDADTDMILPHLKTFSFDKAYISEEVQSYKNDQSGRIFLEALKHYGTDPSGVIHIGDSASDILGASRVGMKSCWLNRLNSDWNHEVKPDYEVTDLNQAADMLLDQLT